MISSDAILPRFNLASPARYLDTTTTTMVDHTYWDRQGYVECGWICVATAWRGYGGGSSCLFVLRPFSLFIFLGPFFAYFCIRRPRSVWTTFMSPSVQS